jgi:secreted PhoX family phosphatase
MKLPTSPTFATLLNERLDRRALLRGAAAGAGALALAGRDALAATTISRPPLTASLAPSRADALLLAPGYRHDILIRWGEALWRGGESLEPRLLAGPLLTRADAAAKQERQFGTNCDAIAFFPLSAGSSRRGLLCVNSEYVQVELAFSGLPHDDTQRAAMFANWIRANPNAVRWMQAAHGVNVIEVERRARGWRYRPGARQTRRITANTPCEIMGPARGAPLLRTNADPTGTRVLGTLANCAGGKTPWGTFLTAEENIDDYFGFARSWGGDTEDFATLAAHARFPLGERSIYGWDLIDRRFDVRVEPREALRFGWIVEIDPFDPTAPPRKRTALGRFSHEGANTVLTRDGRVAAYMGDDDKFEYVYKFVTRGRFDPANRAANRDLLDDGTLYVARFDADGRGEWLPLVYDPNGPLNAATGFTSQADVVIKARAAADLLGATPMDRPEDVEPSPVSGRVYIALTKNGDRTGARARDFYTNREIELGPDAANPRPKNDYGHIVELIEQDEDAAATRFSWQVFLLAGNPQGGGTLLTRYEDVVRGGLKREDTWYAGQSNPQQLSPIACPDNLGFDREGRLWIVTDTDDYSFGNNGCYVVPTTGPERGLLRQVASAPVGAEVCGCEFTPDGRTLFLSIQHPGEGGSIDAPVSHWPDGGSLPPRSAVVAIEREDGAPL